MLSVWEGLEDLNLGLIKNLDNLSGLGEGRHSLGDELDTTLLGLLLQDIVALNSLDESLVASALSNVLNSNVNSLAELLTTVDLGNFNTDSRLGDVEHNTGSAVVELIRHTLVNRRISNNINVVSLLEHRQISGHVWHTLSSEGLGELVPCLRSKPEVMWHRKRLLLEKNMHWDRLEGYKKISGFFAAG